ncbi:MAG: hypothetical protein CBC25_06615 [Pelagibacteraceae bacterium TMED65]|nr:hypothetical protein [Rickettsiales bacterium]OUU51090.1 MAG: hypothetical protein CBC25_06615 [Pelagibacteraceae bacterium TMED65]
MIKDTIILFLILLYIIGFFIWIYFFYKLIKKNIYSKKRTFFINIVFFVFFTYLTSFLILKVLS